MSLEIAWKQNILVTDSNLLKSLLFVFGFGSQAFVCEFSRQNICSVLLLQGDSFIHFFFFTKEHHAFKKDLSCGHSIHHQRELEGNKHFAFISTVLSELQPT